MNFNKQLSGYRSTIERFFANFCNIFKRFNSKSNTRITKEKTYNIQLKLAILVYNIKNFVEKNNVVESSYFKLWMEENFDFFNDTNDFESMVNNTPRILYKKENIIHMKDIQNDTLNKFLSENNCENLKINTKMEIDKSHEVDNDDVYEIQYIIQHRIVNDQLEYEVKWRNYKKQVNSWVKDNDFLSKEILNQYWSTINE